MHIGFWSGDLNERDHLDDLDVEGRMMLKWILRKWDEEAWTRLLWIRIRTGGGIL
jgi:hypothetical protein